MAMIGKNIGKLKQWTSEKIGGAEKTDTSEEFKTLEYDTEQRREALEKLEVSMDVYLKALSKRKPTAEDKTKTMPIEALGTCMINQSYVIGDDTPYGQCLIKAGEAHEKIASVQGDFVNQARMGFYSNLERSLLDMKEYQNLRKKLENRRLDLDSKLNKVQKAKKEKPELEEEVRGAQVKYEDSLAEAHSRMVMIAESEEYHVKELTSLVEAELEYYTKAASILVPVLESLTSINSSTRGRKIKTPVGTIRNGASSISRSNTLSESKAWARERSVEAVSPPPQERMEYFEEKPVIRKSATVSQRAPARSNPPLMPRRKEPAKQVKCTFAFDSTEPDELSIEVGDVITVIKEIDEGWWIGEMGEGRAKLSGMFPVNYTEPFRAPPPRPEQDEYLSDNYETRSTGALHDEPDEQDFDDEPARPAFRRSATSSSSPSFTRTAPASYNPPLPSRDTEPTQARAVPSPPSRGASSTSRAPPRPSGPKPGMASSAPSRPAMQAPSSLRGSPLRNPNNAASALAQAVNSCDDGEGMGHCNECGCDDYSANVFKKGTCNNCFHRH